MVINVCLLNYQTVARMYNYARVIWQ